MYIIDMAISMKKKPVTVYLQEIKYLIFQQMAADQNRKAAELVREAMDEYIQNHANKKKSLNEWKPVSLGGIKTGSKDWISKDYQNELLGRGF
jgi:hypothetical protein